MANQQVTITIIDTEWPHLKLLVNRQGQVQTARCLYDGAQMHFEPAVKDALRYAVEAVIKSHKGR